MTRRSPFGLWMICFGIIAVALGIWPPLQPQAALGSLAFILGILMMLNGISQIIFYAEMRQYALLRPVVMLVTGILSIITGIFVTFSINFGVLAIGTLFPLWFFCHCISRLCNMDYIKPFVPRWQYILLLVICALGFLLGVAMLLYAPATAQSSAWMVGIYLVLLGADSLVLGFGPLGARKQG